MPNPGYHGMMPDISHDENALMDFVGSFKGYVTSNIQNGNKEVYEKLVVPKFKKNYSRKPKDRHEVHREMKKQNFWQFSGSLSRLYQELKQEASDINVYRQADLLAKKAKSLRTNKSKSTLELDAELKVPKYLSAVDIHLLPGCYYTERTKDDVTAGAMYDPGVYMFALGSMGKYNEDMGEAAIRWIEKNYPEFYPNEILDMGCSVGHCTLPYADKFPQSEITAIDIGAPVLRYAQARSESLGYKINFKQQNAENTKFKDKSFDLIVSHILLHETSRKATYNIMKECHRLLKPGGIVVHADVPINNNKLDPFIAFTRDWSTHYNAEPFWGTLHDMDLNDPAICAGFNSKKIFIDNAPKTKDSKMPPWLIFGAMK